MRIPKSGLLNHKILLVSIVAVLIILSGAAFVYGFGGNLFGWSAQENNAPNPHKPHINYEKPTDEQKTGEQTTESSENSKPNESITPPSESGKKKVEMLTTALAQNGSMLQIRTLIYTVTNTGTCTLTLSKVGSSSTIITKTAPTQSLSSSTTCKGFDVPVSELSSGKWDVSVTFENDTMAGTAATKNVETR